MGHGGREQLCTSNQGFVFTFGHSLVVQSKELLILLVHLKLCIGSKVIITYTVYFSFGYSGSAISAFHLET